jgi:CheY-like chemotaxis protein
MDINMPVLDGTEAARLLKASPATHGVNVIAYTAKADFYEGPSPDYLSTSAPASPDAITARVRGLVEGSGR